MFTPNVPMIEYTVGIVAKESTRIVLCLHDEYCFKIPLNHCSKYDTKIVI
jgi:hypothetical protein